MGEPRPDTPAADPPRATAIGASLAPPQQAFSDWVTHRLACLPCRDIDSGDCDKGKALWRAYKDRDREAYERLSASDR
ncbi:hypothetical protein ACWDBD_11480 [Streptomyces sp. NPDC001118]